MTDRNRWVGEASAKVNLRLEVLAREASGYHQIETVFQLLELSDRLEIERTEDTGLKLDVVGVDEGTLGPPEENLAIRAARAFFSALDNLGTPSFGVQIRLEKQIPHGAGLGGGSSDAASVLTGLNSLAGMPLSRAELMKIGGTLGSDVPFFLSGASRALAWGRGDRLLELPSLSPRDVLLAVPSERIATAWAYDALAEQVGDRVKSAHYFSGGEVTDPRWDDVAEEAVNDFESVLFLLRTDLPALKRSLEVSGGNPVLLSGSGSAVFAVFEESGSLDSAAEAAANALPGVSLFQTKTVG